MKVAYSYLIGFFLTILFLLSCQNEESLIGESFLNNDSHSIFILDEDLININAFSVLEDSVAAQSSVNLLGSYLDPYFGSSDASFSFQITLPNNEISFNASSITNISLNLPYTNFYGDSLATFNIVVSTLTESINSNDSLTFFSNDKFSTNMLTTLNAIDLSLIADSGVLNIELPTSFGLSEILNLSNANLANTEAFTEAFYGFNIEVEPIFSNNGAIMYFNLSDENSALNITYINNENETQSISFPTTGTKLNHFTHNYTNTIIETTDSLLFLQSMGGTFCELNFSFLENLKDSGYIVNNAELSLSVFAENNFSQIPDRITLIENNNDDLLPIEGLSGGFLDEESQSYTFNITQHIQKILTEDHNPACRLYTYSRTSNADRVILNNTLDLLGEKSGGMVLGHTPHYNITSQCRRKLWFADVGLSKAFGNDMYNKVQVLEIKNNIPKVI